MIFLGLVCIAAWVLFCVKAGESFAKTRTGVGISFFVLALVCVFLGEYFFGLFN